MAPQSCRLVVLKLISSRVSPLAWQTGEVSAAAGAGIYFEERRGLLTSLWLVLQAQVLSPSSAVLKILHASSFLLPCFSSAFDHTCEVSLLPMLVHKIGGMHRQRIPAGFGCMLIACLPTFHAGDECRQPATGAVPGDLQFQLRAAVALCGRSHAGDPTPDGSDSGE
jgi:hypothetical protein